MKVYIKAGEDFGTLARDYLGSGTKWNVIAAANPQYPVTWKVIQTPQGPVNSPFVTLRVGDPVVIPGVQDPVDTTNDDFTFIPDPSPTPNDPLVVFPDLVVPAVVNPQPAPSPEPSYYPDPSPSHFDPVVQTTETKKEEESGWGKWLLIGGLGLAIFGKKLFGTGRSR